MPRKPRPDPKVVRERILEHLKTLAIVGLDNEVLDALIEQAIADKASFEELIERVLGHAARLRIERRIERRIRESGLTEHKTLEAFDFNFQPNLDRRVIEQLATLRFLERKQDLLLTGKTGTGKSHILKALALRACKAGLAVRYTRCVDLLADTYAGLADGSYERRVARWCRPVLLVIDDVGLGQAPREGDDPTAAHMLYNLIDLRHQRVSTAISSNIKLSAWGRYLGDATVTAAILDRVAMHATRVEINGPSYRQHCARSRDRPPAPRKKTNKRQATAKNEEPATT